VFGYSHQTIEASLLESLEQEIAALSDFDPAPLIRREESFTPPNIKLEISGIRNYPNPFGAETTFIYELSKDANAVSIVIYTSGGRRVRILDGLSAQEGYNEAMWDGRDETGARLSNGVYFYKVRVASDEEQIQAYGRMAILR
jgi:flagellar hook assembly protein FlgD